MKTILSLLTMSIFCSTFAQEFSFPIYFEDALGNKDTIVIGYDATATNGIDPQFGEVDILNQPWQGPLDVRVGTMVYLNQSIENEREYLTKKAIQSYECIDYNTNTSFFSVEFYAENLPITMKWDKNIFITDSCVYNTTMRGYITSGHDVLKFQQLDSVEIKYINPQDNFYLKDTLKVADFNNHNFFAIKSLTIENKNIGVFNFTLKTKNTLSKSELTDKPYNIYPNPSNDFINIETEAEIINLEIFDALGKSVLQQTGNSKTVQIEHLEVGMYTLKIDTQIGAKFVKINKL